MLSQPTPAGGPWRRNPWFWAALLVMALFAGLIVRYHHPGTGWTSLISIGSKMEKHRVDALVQTGPHIVEGSHGYDGQFYVQLALHPLLRSPELEPAIDDPAYRARRIMMPWAAWLLGAGQPAWIVQAYALLNPLCWLLLAVLLWRWLPPVNADNFLRWAGVLGSHGVCMSVRHSLTDAPSLLLLAVAMCWWEKQRSKSAMAAVAAAALTKETAVLAGVLWAEPPLRGWRQWGRLALIGGLIIAPLALWLGYVRWRFGANSGEEGLHNFTLPLAGLAGKWAETLGEIRREGWSRYNFPTLLTVAALSVQLAFFLFRWRWREAWWRVGGVFAVLGLLVSQPVWEGHPGAATRVLLPMMLAFNLLVPRGRRWLAVLLAGNLSLVAGVLEFHPPRANLVYFQGEPALAGRQTFTVGEGWYLPELKGWQTRRWARQSAGLELHNHADAPVTVQLKARLSALSTRQLTLQLNGVPVWSAGLNEQAQWLESPPLVLQPGVNRLEFVTDSPAEKPAQGDERELSFCVWELAVQVRPAAADLPARD